MRRTKVPCPGCGSASKLDGFRPEKSEGRRCVAIGCKACGWRGPAGDDLDQALELWERRAKTKADKLVEELRSFHRRAGFYVTREEPLRAKFCGFLDRVQSYVLELAGRDQVDDQVEQAAGGEP